MATDSQKIEEIRGEPVWKKLGYFGDEKLISTLKRRVFQKRLCYMNQEYLSLVI